MSLVSVPTDPSSSSLSADLGICSVSARRLFNVTSGATACGCAPATVDSIMTTRKVAMQTDPRDHRHILGMRTAR
jgi:hypothetical protein